MKFTMLVVAACLSVVLVPSLAQAQAGAATINQGAPDVRVEEHAAARAGDAGDAAGAGTGVVGGSDSVFINGRPAARAGDATACGGIVVGGSTSVFVNGKPLAAAGDQTSGCK